LGVSDRLEVGARTKVFPLTRQNRDTRLRVSLETFKCLAQLDAHWSIDRVAALGPCQRDDAHATDLLHSYIVRLGQLMLHAASAGMLWVVSKFHNDGNSM